MNEELARVFAQINRPKGQPDAPLYHGTKVDAEVLEPGKRGHSPHVWLTDDPEEAWTYAQQAPGEGEPKVYEVHRPEGLQEGAVRGRYRAPRAVVKRRVR